MNIIENNKKLFQIMTKINKTKCNNSNYKQNTVRGVLNETNYLCRHFAGSKFIYKLFHASWYITIFVH